MFRPEVLQAALTVEQSQQGFALQENDHCLYLLTKERQ